MSIVPGFENTSEYNQKVEKSTCPLPNIYDALALAPKFTTCCGGLANYVSRARCGAA